MEKLNLPEYEFRFRNATEHIEIFDSIRKKFVALTPEEWVRQNFLMYLVNELKYPVSLMAIEHNIIFNKMNKRTDITVFGQKGQAVMIIECKASNVTVNQNVFEQIARYNFVLKVPYLVVTNGIYHYCCKVDYINNEIYFLKNIPQYYEINDM
jgi:hypothetical protein